MEVDIESGGNFDGFSVSLPLEVSKYLSNSDI